jgi:hypothetical protein
LNDLYRKSAAGSRQWNPEDHLVRSQLFEFEFPELIAVAVHLIDGDLGGSTTLRFSNAAYNSSPSSMMAVSFTS